MLRWNNDYNRGAHPAILKALEETNDSAFAGYGMDERCASARKEIAKYLGGANADIHFLIGGTQTNFVVIAAALRPYQSVISADTGHIHVHETGAVENTGHKIQTLKAENGKLTAQAVAKEAQRFRDSGVQEHITEPKMVYISFPTEFGTIYSKQELNDIYAVCREYDMYLFVDGARMGYGLGSDECDMTLAELAASCDVFYLGGTKCGALFGEALVIINDELKPMFRSYMKQSGAMLAKGFLLGIQFETLFKDGLYFDACAAATRYAMRIKKAFEEKGIPAYIPSPTNQQFVVLTEAQMEQIGKSHIYEYEENLGGGRHAVRFCTSWATKEEDVDILVDDILKL